MTSVADNGIRGRAGSLWSYLRTEATRWLVVPALAEALFVLPLVGCRGDHPPAGRLGRISLRDGRGLGSSNGLSSSASRRPPSSRVSVRGGSIGRDGSFSQRPTSRSASAASSSWGRRSRGGRGSSATGPPSGSRRSTSRRRRRSTTSTSCSTSRTSRTSSQGCTARSEPGSSAERASGGRSGLVDFLLPPIFLTTAFFVMFGYKALRFAFFRESGFTVTRAGEWAEFCLALGFSVFAFLQWRRLGRGRARRAMSGGSFAAASGPAPRP